MRFMTWVFEFDLFYLLIFIFERGHLFFYGSDISHELLLQGSYANFDLFVYQLFYFLIIISQKTIVIQNRIFVDLLNDDVFEGTFFILIFKIFFEFERGWIYGWLFSWTRLFGCQMSFFGWSSIFIRWFIAVSPHIHLFFHL